MIKQLKENVLNGYSITRDEAIGLWEEDLRELCSAADEIRKHFCHETFDLCSIINGKSGKCSENCKYCAQASCYHTQIEEYPLLDADHMVEMARYNYERGVKRFSIVTSGRRLSNDEVNQVCSIVERIRNEVGIEVCISGGLLDQKSFEKLYHSGVTRVHNNLESSEHFFPEICTTHTYQDKINAIRAAKAAGMSVCSGGIIGLGESYVDRIDMALCLRKLGIKSIPVNVLNPIKGTPLEHNNTLSEDEVLRTIAIFRFIHPSASIRMAGGRGNMKNAGINCFMSGANAAITGDMLTTNGITIANDLEMLKELGFEPGLYEG